MTSHQYVMNDPKNELEEQQYGMNDPLLGLNDHQYETGDLHFGLNDPQHVKKDSKSVFSYSIHHRVDQDQFSGFLTK